MQKTETFLKSLPVTCHTDYISPEGTFVAIQGQEKNGIDFIPEALKLGASKIIVQDDALLSQELLDLINKYEAELVKVKNTRKALAKFSAEAYGYPAKSLKILGITGTKGKTTTAYLTEHILKKAGYKTALISSVCNKILDKEYRSTLTTPQPDFLHAFLQQCKEQEVDYVVMEVAAQATTLYRTHGIEFEGLIFTNFSLEHSEFYKTQEDYFQAKKDLILQRKKGAPLIVNSDDPKVYSLRLEFDKVLAIGLNASADTQASLIKTTLQNGIEAQIISNSIAIHLRAPYLLGEFNVYNILAAFSLTYALGIKANSIVKALIDFKSPKGRLETFRLPNGAIAFIDYAHNPSSFKSLFKAIKSLANKTIVVFGAGGGKDKTKRPLMGSISAKYNDTIILTTDNPRDEDPQEIIDNIKKGITENLAYKVVEELDREEAIKKAYNLSNSGDIILILGKGPDEYQIVKGKKTYFSELEILRKL